MRAGGGGACHPKWPTGIKKRQRSVCVLARDPETLPGKVSMFNWQAWRQRERRRERKTERRSEWEMKKGEKNEKGCIKRGKTEKKKEKEWERKSSKSKNAREQRTERERGRETSKETENKNQRERGTECADAAFLVWTPQINNQQRFSRAVPGTGAYCQAPGQARPSLLPPLPPPLTTAPHPATPSSQPCSGAE